MFFGCVLVVLKGQLAEAPDGAFLSFQQLDVGEDGDWLKQGAMFLYLDREYFVIWCNLEEFVSVYG